MVRNSWLPDMEKLGAIRMTSTDARRSKTPEKCSKGCVSGKHLEWDKSNILHKVGTSEFQGLRSLNFTVLLMPNGDGQFMLTYKELNAVVLRRESFEWEGNRCNALGDLH